jgi:hypothetical protein
MAWCTFISVVKPCPLIARIVEDIDQEAVRSIPDDFGVNLLPRRVAMQEKPGDHSGHVCSLNDGLEPPK